MSDGIVSISGFTSPTSRTAGAFLLSCSDVERLLTPDESMAAVEDAFRRHALGKAPPPGKSPQAGKTPDKKAASVAGQPPAPGSAPATGGAPAAGPASGQRQTVGPDGTRNVRIIAPPAAPSNQP